LARDRHVIKKALCLKKETERKKRRRYEEKDWIEKFFGPAVQRFLGSIS